MANYEGQIDMPPDSHITYKMMEEIYSELDVMKVSFKILKQIIELINADKASLFLKEGAVGNEILVSKLFDIQKDTNFDFSLRSESNYIYVPISKGIVGEVAETKKIQNISDAYSNSKFCSDVDKQTGYSTKSILCAPILNPNNEVIAVVSAINKLSNDAYFTKEDEELFITYSKFCAFALTNANLHEKSTSYSNRIEVILKMAHRLFEKQTKVETLISEIMKGSRELLQCRECIFALLKRNTQKEESKILCRISFQDEPPSTNLKHDIIEKLYKMQVNNTNSIENIFAESISQLDYPNVIESVLETKQAIYIPLVQDNRTCHTVRPFSKSILCCPIFSKEQQLIAVVEFTDKLNGYPFNNYDLDAFKLLSVFYGLGISNVQYYEMSMSEYYHNQVSLEILTYHIFPTDKEMEYLKAKTVPTAERFNLNSFDFDDSDYSPDQLVLASLRMFIECEYLTTFKVDYGVMCKFLVAVKNNYRQVVYHNWRHAFNVAQCMYCMLKKTNHFNGKVSELHGFALLIALLSHDLDHRGTNNTFQEKFQNPLSHLYGTSVMEQHHFNQFLMIINFPGCDVFSELSEYTKQEALSYVCKAILYTDLGNFFRVKKDFNDKVEKKTFDWNDDNFTQTIVAVAITGCDLSAICKPWNIQKRVATMVAHEFFQQGDIEKVRGDTVDAMMDREKVSELPNLQIKFIDGICLFIYKPLANLFPVLVHLLNGCLTNRQEWENKSKQHKENIITEFSEAFISIDERMTPLPCCYSRSIESITTNNAQELCETNSKNYKQVMNNVFNKNSHCLIM